MNSIHQNVREKLLDILQPIIGKDSMIATRWYNYESLRLTIWNTPNGPYHDVGLIIPALGLGVVPTTICDTYADLECNVFVVEAIVITIEGLQLMELMEIPE